MSKKRKKQAQRKRQAQAKRSNTLPWVVGLAVVLGVALIGFSWWSANNPTVRDYDYALAEEYPALGDPNAPVVIENFSDFLCSHCATFARTTFERILHEFIDQNQVKFVYKYAAFIGQGSQLAAEAAQCAHEQGEFWGYHDLLYQRQAAGFTKANLKQYAVQLGTIDTGAFNACVDGGRYASLVRESTNEARRRGVNGTPQFFVNDAVIEGNQPYGVFHSRIRAELSQ